MERPRASHHPASSLIVAILAVAAIARAQSPALEWCGTFLDRERAFATDTVEIARSVEEWTPLWTPLARLAPSTFDPATHAAVRIILGRSRVDASLLHVAVVREEEGSVVIHYTQHAKRPSYPQTAMFGVGHNMVQPTSHAPPPIRAYLVRSVPKTSLPIVAKAWPNPFAFLISELKREHAARDVVDALQPLTNRRGSSPDEWSLSIDRGSASSTIRALAEAMKSREATIRRYAVEALIGFGRDAYEARVPLVDALRDPDELTRTAAADALGAIGEVASYAVPALGRALEDSSCAVRHSAVVALARMGTSSLPLKDKLIAAVSNPAPCDRTDVSDAAAWALSLFGYRVVPSVIAALPNSSVEARRLFVQVLGAIGPEAWESVPALITGLTDPDVEIRRYVVRSLGQIGPGSKGAVDGVARLLDDDDVEVRRRSATALGEIGAAASAAVPDLVAAIADPDATVRSNAIEALGRIGPESRGSIPELTKALADPWLRRFAVVALGRIGPDASTAVPILLPLLSDPSIQGEVAVALGGIGLASRDAIPALLELGKKNDSDVGAQAVLALGKIGVEALPALREALRSSRDSKRQIIVQAIGEIGPPARAALPELLDQLTDESIRLASLTAIARVASDIVKLRGDLQSGTDSQFGKNLEVTRSTAVSSIAAAGIDWLPLLIEKLRSPESFVRTFAANGIESMGTRANSAIPALVSA
ncbi:MAG: HEAT repeat domain-containing protein, partial [Planctomycetes bacterium]|nr:HEAT repeat domain-containing protein [Planctomycetota bacterium]